MAAKESARLNIGIFPKGIGIGAAVSIMTTILGVAIAAWLLATETIGEGSIGYITVALLLLSSILGAFISVCTVKQKRAPVCFITGGVYLLSLLAINALFFHGTYSGVGESTLVILAGVLSVAILGLKGKKKHKIRTRK